MKKIVFFSLMIMLVIPCFSFSQEEEIIDVDKEISAVMEKMVKRLGEVGLNELRDGLEENVRQLYFYYKARGIAVQLNNKKLLEQIDWFIQTTEKSIKANLKFIRRLDVHLWKLKQKLEKLLKEKNRIIRKNKQKRTA